MRPGDVITGPLSGRTATVLGVQQVVAFNQDATHGEYRVALRVDATGRKALLVRTRAGAPGLTDTQVRNALANVDADLRGDVEGWLDR